MLLYVLSRLKYTAKNGKRNFPIMFKFYEIKASDPPVKQRAELVYLNNTLVSN